MAPRAIQKGVRQSARKVRLVVDTIRGKNVNEAYALLRFSKKRAARQIEKVLRSAVANAEQDADRESRAFDVDDLYVSYAIANEGETLWRWRPAAYGRATPIRKRMSTIEIRVEPKEEK
ncbi:MAG: 50S ribosomal protein L22 [Gemmatimonadetes bacterium]|nr:50S ribosomal protein L22 [Gemmatimonadota bacterium]MCH8144019.1 50S ribosomal protein L22 [Gemmatimonadota bacterium]MCH8254993.1 50S ribosomal protein L22 [Gemmatimonadota bacterium]MCH8934506.1 50S ribosomal protein L22 [Gemmatimonadota bacterium]MCH8938820.1 50S ribosomal protein L22 [Gemmatimonadota bacterium]